MRDETLPRLERQPMDFHPVYYQSRCDVDDGEPSSPLHQPHLLPLCALILLDVQLCCCLKKAAGQNFDDDMPQRTAGELPYRAGKGDAWEPWAVGGVDGANDAFERRNGQHVGAQRGGKVADAVP